MTSGDKIYLVSSGARVMAVTDDKQKAIDRWAEEMRDNGIEEDFIASAIEDEDFGDNDTAYLYESVWL